MATIAHPNNLAYPKFSKLYFEAFKGEKSLNKLIPISEAMNFWKIYFHGVYIHQRWDGLI